MNFPTAVRSCLSKYVTFEGRAARSEYWYFQLFTLLVYLVFVVVYLIAPRTAEVVGVVSVVVHIGFYLPVLAVTVRRLHDRNRSGWNVLWVLVPFFGAIVLIIWFCQRGVEGDNRFGPDPLAASAGH